MAQIITIFGATGIQGGSVIRSILSDPSLSKDFRVRGVTRDISKPAAQALAELGAEIVKGDLDSAPSVAAVIKGSHTVFLVTNFWETMNLELEINQGKTVADAAKAAGVSHLIFSSLISVSKTTDGKFKNVPHFDGKAEIEEYIRDIGVPSTFFLPGYYMANYTQLLAKNEDGSYTLAYPVSQDTKFPLFDATADTGKFVKAIIRNREKLLGKYVLGATAYYTPEQIVADFSAVTGKIANFVKLTAEQYTTVLPPMLAKALLESHLFIESPGYFKGESLAQSLAILEEKPVTWKEFVRRTPAFN
ncbi:NmrA family transcriptional regulator [Cadophora sp. MPI-SDFR-AT-0126]|nr:NmrA family transcriptional regulator [Leotiomycetes sp. MPI-SDFR-AT-0126]